MVRFIIAIVLCGWSLLSNAQNIDAFVTATLSTRNVVVEQPVKVKVKAYSATWFAKPLTFQNLKVEGAFVQSFKQTVSSIDYVDGKKYACLEFYYMLIPYYEGKITFQALNISTSIPPVNEYRGKEVILTTKPIVLTVNPIPENADKNRWLVASNVNIQNRWSGNISDLKMGDVITRTITITANGTLPSFIDEPAIGDIEFGNIYTTEPRFVDQRDNKSLNGKRIDVYSYLLEEEGEFVVPEVEVSWWNPYAKRYFKRKLPEYTLVVKDNPGLASLQHLKDSLNALNPAYAEDLELQQAKKPWTFYLKHAIVIAILVLLIRLLYGSYKSLIKNISNRNKAYKQSERYHFKKALQQNEAKSFLNKLYYWTGIFKGFKSNEKTLRVFGSGNTELEAELNLLKKSQFSAAVNNESVKVSKGIKMLSAKQRRKLLSNNNAKQESKYALKNINP